MKAHFFALFKKYLIVSRRNFCSSLIELLAPIIGLGLIMLVRLAVTPTTNPQASQFTSGPQPLPIVGNVNLFNPRAANVAGTYKTQDPITNVVAQNASNLQSTTCANTPGNFSFNQTYWQTQWASQLAPANPTIPATSLPAFSPTLACAASNVYPAASPPLTPTLIFNSSRYVFNSTNNPECFISGGGTVFTGGTKKGTPANGQIALVGPGLCNGNGMCAPVGSPTNAQAFLYALQNDITQNLLPPQQTARFMTFSSVENLNTFVLNTNTNDVTQQFVCAAIVFQNLSIPGSGNTQNTYDQSIHMKSKQMPNINQFKNLTIAPSALGSRYYSNGYSGIQVQIDNFIIQQEATFKSGTGVQTNNISMTLIPMTTQSYVQDILLVISSNLIQFIMGIAFCPSVVTIVSSLVRDKEQKQREGMTMMGLTTFVYYSSFFCYRLIIAIVQALAMAGILNGVLYKNSNQAAIFVVQLGLSVTTVSISFMMSTLFTTTRSASIISVLIYFGSIFIVIVQNSGLQVASEITGGSILPMMFVQFQSIVISSLESNGTGLQFSNMAQRVNGFSSADGLQGCIIANLIQGALTFYFEYALPKEYGTSQGPFFFLKPSFWIDSNVVISEAEEEDFLAKTTTDKQEPLGKEYEMRTQNGDFLRVSNLKKIFGKHIAVNDVNLMIYESDIFALLGHNGAGKTTTINMITGLLMPDSGEANFKNVDLFQQMNKIRTTLGVCPQLDVLFEDMTVREHLEMFQTQKDPKSNFLLSHDYEQNMTVEVDKYLDKLVLRSYANELTQNLSGGTKRRLSVAIALIGDSKLVLLDEPTSGMDITSRQQLWDILKDIKKNRTVILTTHYMDEAEYLGDRIAIMGEGKIRCCGSSQFLKNKQGGGYKLVAEKNTDFQSETFLEFVRKFANAEIKEENHIKIELSLSKENMNRQGELFSQLEANKQTLNILSYGFSDSNLEDVFLKVSEDNENHNGTNLQDQTEEVIKRSDVYFLHFFALLLKRYRQYKRDLFGVTCEILLPIFCAFLGVLLQTYIGSFTSNSTTQYLDPGSIFGQTVKGITTGMGANLKIQAADQSSYTTANAQQTNATVDSIYNGYTLQSPQLSAYKKYTLPASTSVDPYFQTVDTSIQIDSAMFTDFLNNINTPEEVALGVSFYNTTTTLSQFVNQNTRFNHIIPMATLWTSNAILQGLQPGNASTIRFGINNLVISNSESVVSRAQNNFWLLFFIIIGISLVPTSAIVLIVKEREQGCKHQQFTAGVSLSSQWLSNLLWDQVKWVITAICIIAVLYWNAPAQWFQNDLNQFNVVMAAFAAYGYMTFAFIQVLSFMFVNLLKAMVVTLSFFLGSGVISQVANVFLLLLIPSGLVTQEQFDIFDRLCTILIPVQNLTSPLSQISNMQANNVRGMGQNGQDYNCMIYIYMSIIIGSCWMFVLLSIESLNNFNFVSGGNRQLEEKQGEDVKELNQYVRKLEDPSNHCLVVRDLNLWQGDNNVIKNVCFKSDKNECLVILGTNGAGKTSIFKCISGETIPNEGSVYVTGLELFQQRYLARKTMGQCPQGMTIIDNLTAVEHLELYGNLKQLSGAQLQTNVDSLMNMMNLRMNGDTLAGQYSGGNKRKLQVAIAMIGHPEMIFLDEPSTGMDPEAKRFMWNSIKKQKKSSSVILTTHSMDEAEGLADKMLVMKDGQFLCQGSLPSLKQKYSKGLQIDLMYKIPKDLINSLIESYNTAGLNVLKQEQIQDYIKQIFGGKQKQSHFKTFGNGKIIHEQLLEDKINDQESTQELKIDENKHTEASLFFEFMGTIKKIQETIGFLKSSFTQVNLVLENIGLLLRVNITADDLSTGKLFDLLESNKEKLGISYYSITMAKMETLFRNIVEDDKNNSLNDCTVLTRNLDQNDDDIELGNKVNLKLQDTEKQVIVEELK